MGKHPVTDEGLRKTKHRTVLCRLPAIPHPSRFACHLPRWGRLGRSAIFGSPVQGVSTWLQSRIRQIQDRFPAFLRIQKRLIRAAAGMVNIEHAQVTTSDHLPIPNAVSGFIMAMRRRVHLRRVIIRRKSICIFFICRCQIRQNKHKRCALLPHALPHAAHGSGRDFIEVAVSADQNSTCVYDSSSCLTKCSALCKT